MDAETKGERAGQILENEVYLEAIEGAKQSIKDEWVRAQGTTEREALWHQYRAIEGVTKQLRIIRDRGILERRQRENASE